MELKRTISILLHNFVFIIVTVVLFMVSSALISTLLIVPKYEASATLIINKSGASPDSSNPNYTYNDYLLSQKLVKTYGVIITSDSVLDQVVENLNLDMSLSDLRKEMTVTGVDDTEILKISVTDSIAQRAVDIANEITRVCPEVIVATSNVGEVKLLDYAKLPKTPVTPNITTNILLAGLLGFAAAASLVIARKYFDTTIKSTQEIEDLTGIASLGQIPKTTAKKGASMEHHLADDQDYYLAEAYKIVATNLEYSILDSQNKSIIITSSVPQEGKTSVTANLGVFLTEIGYNVLLIDCDLRKPKLHRFFNISNISGVTSIVFNKIRTEDGIVRLREKLHILCSGPVPPNAVKVLSSMKMKEIIAEVSKLYDYVLIDMPPSAFLTDASILASSVSGVIFVTKYGATPQEAVTEAVGNLKKANANFVGSVLSQIEMKQIGGNYMYRYRQQYEPSPDPAPVKQKRSGYKYRRKKR